MSDVDSSYSELPSPAIIKKWLADADCPMASVMVWSGILMAFYYALAMPDSKIKRAEQGVKVSKISGNVRATLALVWLIGGVVGWYLVKSQCDASGNNWKQVVWGLLVFIGLGVVSVLVLALTQDSWKISTASEFLNYLNKNDN